MTGWEADNFTVAFNGNCTIIQIETEPVRLPVLGSRLLKNSARIKRRNQLESPPFMQLRDYGNVEQTVVPTGRNTVMHAAPEIGAFENRDVFQTPIDAWLIAEC